MMKLYVTYPLRWIRRLKAWMMGKPKLHTVMDELAQDTDTIIAAPESVDRLRKQGFPFRDVPAQTLDELFEERKASANKILPSLPPLPNERILPHAVKSLYQEVRECIFFGLNGAAITLSGNLIEFVLKHCAFVQESGGYDNYDPEKWDDFETNVQFGDAIGRAKRAGLVESDMAKRLQLFREDIRNPYSHYNIQQITQNVIAGKVKVLNLTTAECKEKDIAAQKDPKIQALVKPWIDEHNVLYVFHFADEVVKGLFAKLEERLQNRKT